MKITIQIIKYLGIYFVSLVLISFAFSKFFNVQFQLSNMTQYTPLKDLSTYNHAWSFLGRSYNYNLFIGLAEFVAGILMLFSRTRLMGLLIALVVYTNIVIIDIEFNIHDAIIHAVVEFVIVLLLLIPYLKDLKTFFWDMAGRLTTEVEPTKKFLQIQLPIIFIVVLSIANIWELKTYIPTIDKIVGAYKVSQFVTKTDTLKIGQGKFTKDPMLFFEFYRGVILSVNDNNYRGTYSTKADSIFIEFDKNFNNRKKWKAKIDKNESKITGVTDKQEPFEIKIKRDTNKGS